MGTQLLGVGDAGDVTGGEEPGAAVGGAWQEVELREIEHQLIDESGCGRGHEDGSGELGLQRGGGMLGYSQQGDASTLPGPQQEHGMRVSATLFSHASSTSASEPPPFQPLPPWLCRWDC